MKSTVSKDPAQGKRSTVLLWLVAIGFFMQTLDTTIVNTALPGMAHSLGESPLRMQAVVVAYALIMAVLTPASGWLADRFGTRRVYLCALALFTLGSLLCASAKSLEYLVLSRVLQGAGGSMLMPVGRLAVLKAFPHERFLKAMSFVTVPGLIGPLLGPTLGGWLTESFSWHWIFLINLPVGVAGIVLTMIFMENARPGKAGRFDLSGFLMIAFGMVAVSYALDGVAELGIKPWAAASAFLAGMLFLAGYGWYAARAKKPVLFPKELFRVKTFRVGALSNFFCRIAGNGTPFLLPLYFQVGMGYSPIESGLLMLPTAVSGMIMKRVSVQLIGRFGYRTTLFWNGIALGAVLCAFVFLSGALWVKVAVLLVFGAVNSLQFTGMNTVTLMDLDDSQASSGNSLLSTVMIFSMGMGVAVSAVLLSLFGASATAVHPVAGHLSAYHAAFVCLGGISMLTSVIFLRLPRHTSRIAGQGPSGGVIE